MRLHRFFSHEKIIDKIESRNQDETSDLIALKIATTQWRKVFRFGPGDKVILFDGLGKDYVCEIKEYKDQNGVSEGEVILKIIEVRENSVKPRQSVSLFVAVVKKDTYEWIVEKATELGVSDIVPVVAERSEKKSLNFDRLKKISIEASEQSGRATVPNIHAVIHLSGAMSEILKRKQPAVVFDPAGMKFSMNTFSDLFNQISSVSVALFIGPEGGWSLSELEFFREAGIPIVSLGQQILRTETAVVASLSRFVF